MIIKKVINNNIVSSIDENGKEIIITGKGLGFQKKVGEEINENLIEKIFKMHDQTTSNKLKDLLADIPLEHIQTCNEIIEYAKQNLKCKLNDNIYITLIDHISFAIERQKTNLNYKNALLWEIKKFYNEEFIISVHILDIIKDRLGVELSEDEAGFIALHIVNSELDTDMSSMYKITELIQDIVNLVEGHYNVKLDQDSLSYGRFVTHLKYFGQRIYKNNPSKDEDYEFQNMIMNHYKNEHECAIKIGELVKEKYDHNLTSEEMMYLTIHLKRVTMEIK